MKRASKGAQVNLDAIPGIAGLRAVAGEDMMQEAFTLLRARLELTPEKLMLMLLRQFAPEERVEQGEEARLRGIPKRDTLTSLKNDGLFKKEINGAK